MKYQNFKKIKEEITYLRLEKRVKKKDVAKNVLFQLLLAKY